MPAAGAYTLGTLPLVAVVIGKRWPFELASHFVVLALLGVLAVGSLCALRRRWLEAAAGGVLVLAYAALCAPCYVAPEPSPLDGRAALKVLSANVYYAGGDARALSAWIAAKDPDVLVLMEITPRWRAALEPALARYPHRLEHIRDDPSGIAVYARASLERFDLTYEGPPMFATCFEHSGRHITLLAVHTTPPIDDFFTKLRDWQLAHVGELARSAGHDVVVAGDLNITSWSPAFRSMLTASHLLDSRRGFGVQASWPSSLPAPLRIPIDHILTSPDIATRHREVGPEIGSDHRPIFAELALR